jgi:hypothetical protein
MRFKSYWRLFQRVAKALTIWDYFPKIQDHHPVLLSCHDVDRAMRDMHGRYSPILEGIRSVVNELGYSTINVTHPYAVFRSREIKGESITINYRSLLIRFICIFRLSESRAKFRRKCEIRLYSILLLKYSPRIIISIQPPAALCVAAKRLGICVVEAMHGTNISLSDKVFAASMSQPVDGLPDVILSFDDVSQNTLSVLCHGRAICTLQTRDPWLHLLRCQQVEKEISLSKPRLESKVILVTLQWGYDGERDSLNSVIPNGILHPALVDVFVKTREENVRYLLRLHPIQMNAAGYSHHRHYIEALCKRYAHLDWEFATNTPLPLVLEGVCGHITMSSSSAGEALVAGVPTLLLCPTLHQGGENYGLFRELESSGMIFFGDLNAADICSWILHCPMREAIQHDPEKIQAAHIEEMLFYKTLIESPSYRRFQS